MLATAMRPYIEMCIEAFGADRSMFASDFPLTKVSYSGTPQPSGTFTSRLSTDRSPSASLDMTTTVATSPYFLGSIVLIKDPQKPEADIVDGQQRLTTLTILLRILATISSTSVVGGVAACAVLGAENA
jgi:hypothetical protein